jgi:diadenylate cyclase
MFYPIKIYFPEFDWSDGVDIFLVAVLLYNLYNLVKGTPAVNILTGIVLIYFAWIIVRAFEMKLVSSVLGKFIDVGVIAIIIVFQQEVRRFLLLLGTSEFINKRNPLRSIFRVTEKMKEESMGLTDINALVKACFNMSEQKTGALIVIVRKSDMKFYVSSGEKIDGALTERMIENIFFKNSPMHDGAVIIEGNKILAARCVLPVTEKEQFPAHYGMRHRAAVGITEISDALAIIVSEQTGAVSVALNGQIRPDLNQERLKLLLEQSLYSTK